MSNSKHELLTPDNCALALIDFQPQMFFGVQSHDRRTVENNMVGLARGARLYGVPTIITSVETAGFSGNTTPGLLDVFPENAVVERSSMNSWEDAGFKAAVEATNRKKLIIAGLWTEVCVTLPAIEATRDGYDVYFVTDASGGTSAEAHDRAVSRMIQAGATPLTWVQTVLEWQRDWSRKEHYNDVLDIMRDHGGAYGQGIEYCSTMVHKLPASRARK